MRAATTAQSDENGKARLLGPEDHESKEWCRKDDASESKERVRDLSLLRDVLSREGLTNRLPNVCVSLL